MPDHNILLRKIGMFFSDQNLLRIALTHASAANEIKSGSTDSNERLEFLGDSLIGLVIANELFRRLPEKPEGYLTELRSYLVNRETLADVAKQISLGDYIVLGQGEKQTGGQYRDSNLSSCFEALMGAVLLDQGFNKAYSVVTQLLSEEIEEVVQNGVERDPKSHLQELTQSMGKGTPQYVLVQQTSEKHTRTFVVEIILDTEVIGKGTGQRKLDAERIAATKAIELLRPLAFDNI